MFLSAKIYEIDRVGHMLTLLEHLSVFLLFIASFFLHTQTNLKGT
jgi:hypothetical protein